MKGTPKPTRTHGAAFYKEQARRAQLIVDEDPDTTGLSLKVARLLIEHFPTAPEVRDVNRTSAAQVITLFLLSDQERSQTKAVSHGISDARYALRMAYEELVPSARQSAKKTG